MANSKIGNVIQHVRRAALLRDGAGMTDGQLLDCFLTQRDDAAFAALVRRHGPMVWGVCRRVVHHHHDAEDAFQATFLVLVRKAGSVEPKEMVANWLYGVAYQTAFKARSVAAKRKKRERQVVAMPEPAVEERDVWHDLQPLLDQELSRLPDKYRVPIVLCDLEGKTRREAARQLGWPEGTVAGRLATARKMLARQLARRGVGLSGGMLAAVLSHNAASACVPPSVVSSTIQAATVLAAGQAATALISVKVAALTEGVLKTMLLTKLKVATAVLLATAIAGVGAVGLLRQTPASEPAKAQARSDKDEKQAAPTPKEDKEKEDKDKLQGTWRLASAENDGLRIGEGREEIKDDRMVIEKSSLTLSFVGRTPFKKPETIKAVADFSLDTKQTPKVIVLQWKKFLSGKEDFTQKAIYAVEGDTLKLCLNLDENEKNPPTDFSANAGSKHWLWVFKRDPASDKKDEKPKQGEEKKGDKSDKP